jgi:signal transduction histidine kinase/HAMP domain-containing protein
VTPRHSLRSNFYLLLTSLVATALVLMVVLFTVAQVRTALLNLDRNVMLAAQLLTEDLGEPMHAADRAALTDRFRLLRGYPTVALACLYDASGKLVTQHSNVAGRVCAEAAAATDAAAAGVLRAVVQYDTATAGTLYLHGDRGLVAQQTLDFVAPTAALALLVFLIVTVVGRRLAERAVAPLKALTASSREIIQGNLAARMAVGGPREVSELAESFNAVIDDLLEARHAAEADLQQRLRIQDALSAAESLLRRIIDLVPYLIFAIRPDGSVIFANRAVAQAYGVPVAALLDGTFQATHADRAPDGLLFHDGAAGSPSGEIWFDHHSGSIRRIHVTRVPFDANADDAADGALVVAVDVTEQRQLEVQLQFSQRLEVVGTLAGGIAHDFNNLLTPIMGYSTILLERDLPEDVEAKLKAIYSAALKARDLVQQILTFSRHQTEGVEKQLIEPATVLEDAVGLMRATVPSSIQFDVAVADDVPPIHANAGQIHQVIVNLCNNAAQAIEGGRGHVQIRLSHADRSAAYFPTTLGEGEFVELRVTDDGVGIPAQLRSRIFEPFFTTKNVGHGSGLGLSVVHGIVTGHGGEITVDSHDSHEGGGTTFHVFLPASAPRVVRAETQREDAVRGHERVLLVDDEVAVVRATKDILENLGYEVSAFTQPANALHQFQSKAAAFDIVVTDNLMPDMTGLELAAAIRERDGAIPIVLMSGFIDDRADRDPAITVSIAKPTSGRELSSLIQRVVHKAAS